MAAPNQFKFIKAKNGALEIQADQNQDTIWLNSNQVSLLFEKDRLVISRHVENI